MANDAVRKYAEWGASYLDFGLAVLSKRLIRRLFDKLPVAEARELGRANGRDEARLLVIAWYNTFNLENVLRFFGSILGRYSGAFIFEHSKNGNVHTVILRHQLGSSASAYFAEYAKTVCQLLDMPASVAETEDQVIITATESLKRTVQAGRNLQGLQLTEVTG